MKKTFIIIFLLVVLTSFCKLYSETNNVKRIIIASNVPFEFNLNLPEFLKENIKSKKPERKIIKEKKNIPAQKSAAQKEYEYISNLISKGIYDKALSELNRFISKYPTGQYYNKANENIGDIYLAKTNYDKAMSYYGRSGGSISIYNLGKVYELKGEYENAVSQYLKLIKVYPSSSYVDEAYTGLGRSFLKIGKPKDAVQYLETANKKYKKSNSYGEILYLLAGIYEDSQEIRNIEKAYKYYLDYNNNIKDGSYSEIVKTKIKYLEDNFIKFK